ncbi:MAG: tRNA 2-thiouridine(34) synthase MnmA [Treponemataceae bacterium]
MKTKKVLVALSGGVDSAVAVELLAERGYELAGATMVFRVSETLDAIQAENLQAAQKICERLGIVHYVFDVTKEFRSTVLDYFVKAYEEGLTPNPCFVCNRKIKFGIFLEKAKELGFDFVATGHYAKVFYDEALERFRLFAGKDDKKDQSYFLAGLNQKQLSQIIFPLQDLTKQEVKKIAKSKGIKTATQKESQDICFVPSGDYTKLIEKFSTKKIAQGDFFTRDGKLVGQHKGIIHYTIGQRRGLNVSLGKPVYVLEKNAKTGKIILGKREELYCESLLATDINFIATEVLQKLKNANLELSAKTRYRTRAKKCIIGKIDKSYFENYFTNELKTSAVLTLRFLEKDFAVAPGQALVLYDGDEIVASGIIVKTKFIT